MVNKANLQVIFRVGTFFINSRKYQKQIRTNGKKEASTYYFKDHRIARTNKYVLIRFSTSQISLDLNYFLPQEATQNRTESPSFGLFGLFNGKFMSKVISGTVVIAVGAGGRHKAGSAAQYHVRHSPVHLAQAREMEQPIKPH